MKPRVFLSHSKSDKVFIEKIANDLRSARIDVWYDEWEIPSGDSFRRQIVKGIDESDLFFVYLTPNSVLSYWVQHEFDTAFVKQANSNRNVLALFVDSEDTRKMVPTDLQSLHAPIFNEEDYIKPFSQLISRAWESYSDRLVQENSEKSKTIHLELENKIKDLELEIVRKSSAELYDTDHILQELNEKIYEIDDRQITGKQFFEMLATSFATSETLTRLERHIFKKLGLSKGEAPPYKSLNDYGNSSIRDIVGTFVILGLVHIEPPTGEITQDYYYLTETGN